MSTNRPAAPQRGAGPPMRGPFAQMGPPQKAKNFGTSARRLIRLVAPQRRLITLVIAFGVASVLRPSRALWMAQIALITGYSLVIAWRLPEMWTHPFGPLLKNVPILAVLVVLLATARRRI